MSTLLSVSVAMLAGLLMTRIAKKLKLPAVTAYLVAGVLIGPYCLGAMHIDGLGFTSSEAVSALSLVSEVALGFIAFSIGNEFRLEDLKATGRQTAVIGVVQALSATLLVDLALVAVHFIAPDKLSVSQAITLGAIATATAPAATLMVVRQYKAKGPLTDLLLPIVALDDAVGLVVRGLSNPFYSDIIKVLGREIDAAGYTMVMQQIGANDDEIARGALMEREKKLRGLIFLGGRWDYSADELGTVTVPFVCCSFTNTFGSLDRGRYSSVTIEDDLAAERAVRELVRLGHRRIA